MSELTYEQWYKLVDHCIRRKIGVGVDDLSDGPSRHAYEDGATPEEYADNLLADEGWIDESDYDDE